MNEIAKIKTPNAPHQRDDRADRGLAQGLRGPEGRPDIRVPFREIALSDADEPPVRVYDPSGPYTDAEPYRSCRGPAPLREPWIAARSYTTIAGREMKPEDNGNVSADHLAPHLSGDAHVFAPAGRASSSPNTNSPRPASSPKR